MHTYSKKKVLSKAYLIVLSGIFVTGCTQLTPVKVLFWGNWADPTVVKDVRKFPFATGAHPRDQAKYSRRHIKLKIKNDRQDASFYYSEGNESWIKLEASDDISGFQHNIFGGFVSVRPGIFVTGKGKAVFRSFRYRGLD